jgi:hypothetical protein
MLSYEAAYEDVEPLVDIGKSSCFQKEDFASSYPQNDPETSGH